LRPRRTLSRYALAVLIVGIATLIQAVLPPTLPSVVSYPAVFLAAWLGGLGPGLLATFLSALAIAYYLPPDFSLAIADPRDQLDLVVFVVLSGALVLGLVRLRQALDAREQALRAAEETSARLDEKRALLEAIVEHAPVGLAFATTDGVIRLQNTALRRLAGTEAAPLVNLRDIATRGALFWKDGGAATPEQWEAILQKATASLIELEAQWRTPSGSCVWVSNRLAPVQAKSDARLMGTVSIVRDTSAEHTIADLREEFAAVIAHDLRSPIAAISLSLEHALRKRVGAEEVVEVPAAALERMSQSARRLARMAEDLLDASGVELGRVRLHRDAVDLSRFVTNLVDELRPSLRGHAVEVDVPALPVTVSVDPLRMAQVVTNLLDNASKYSRPRTPIHVALREDAGGAALTVADEGEGIDPAGMPRLFDRFFQARRAREQKEGLGLGLYISKGVVDAHGGRLSAESTPGVGSTFRVWLPA
jgi:PAS domain S-box-containing protein